MSNKILERVRVDKPTGQTFEAFLREQLDRLCDYCIHNPTNTVDFKGTISQEDCDWKIDFSLTMIPK